MPTDEVLDFESKRKSLSVSETRGDFDTEPLAPGEAGEQFETRRTSLEEIREQFEPLQPAS